MLIATQMLHYYNCALQLVSFYRSSLFSLHFLPSPSPREADQDPVAAAESDPVLVDPVPMVVVMSLHRPSTSTLMVSMPRTPTTTMSNLARTRPVMVIPLMVNTMSSFPTVASRPSGTVSLMLTLATLPMFPTLASPTMVLLPTRADPDLVVADPDSVVEDPDTSLTKRTNPYALNNYIIYCPDCDLIKVQ
jgi:hypothetical protein